MKAMSTANEETVVVSDSYNHSSSTRSIPNVIECIVTTQKKVTSRSKWIQLSQGQQPYNIRPEEDELLKMQGRKYQTGNRGRGQYKFVTRPSKAATAGKMHRTKRKNPTTNPSLGEIPKKQRKSKLSKKSRYGGPEGKIIRRKQNQTKTYDEIAVYATAEMATNKFTGNPRKYGGKVKYYFFKIVPKDVKIPKSEWQKKYGDKK